MTTKMLHLALLEYLELSYGTVYTTLNYIIFVQSKIVSLVI